MSKQILSIDVGIKNLSFCLFEVNNEVKILKWDNIDLTKQDAIESTCVYIDDPSTNVKAKKTAKSKAKSKIVSLGHSLGPCGKPAKYIKDNKCYCLKHSKLTNYLQPASDLKPASVNKQTIQKLIDIINKYKIVTTNSDTNIQSFKKAQLINLIKDFSEKHCFEEVKKSNASKIDLVTIGRNIQHRFDEILCDYLATIDTIIIENQIGPIANKMKTIQGML